MLFDWQLLKNPVTTTRYAEFMAAALEDAMVTSAEQSSGEAPVGEVQAAVNHTFYEETPTVDESADAKELIEGILWVVLTSFLTLFPYLLWRKIPNLCCESSQNWNKHVTG